MVAERTFLKAALLGLAANAVLGLAMPILWGLGDATFLTVANYDLPAAHAALGLFAFLVPAFTALHLHSTAALLKRPAPPGKAKRIAVLWLAGAFVVAGSIAFGDSLVQRLVAGLGWLVLLAAAGMTTGLVLSVVPRRGESVVDVTRDPLTKGDDASFMHARFAHFVLPVGVLLMAIAAVAPIPSDAYQYAWAMRLHRAGIHLLLAAYALFSCYGLSHLWVPRLSGVPAIAAGAIKGELHSSLLALVLLLPGLAFDVKGLVIAGGAFLFLGAFTFMGVLGANIMRNKSRTARVTPEFVYVPWTFTGVFWLISGVLLGIFLNVVPDAFASRAASLRFAHIHIALFGGFAQILLGLATRILPPLRGQPALSFHRAKWGFYLLNAGLATMLYGHLADGPTTRTFQVGAALALLGLAAAFIPLLRNRRPPGGP